MNDNRSTPDFNTMPVNGRKLPPREHAAALLDEMVTFGLDPLAAETLVAEMRNALAGAQINLDVLLKVTVLEQLTQDKVDAYESLRFSVYRLLCLADALAKHAGEVPLMELVRAPVLVAKAWNTLPCGGAVLTDDVGTPIRVSDGFKIDGGDIQSDDPWARVTPAEIVSDMVDIGWRVTLGEWSTAAEEPDATAPVQSAEKLWLLPDNIRAPGKAPRGQS